MSRQEHVGVKTCAPSDKLPQNEKDQTWPHHLHLHSGGPDFIFVKRQRLFLEVFSARIHVQIKNEKEKEEHLEKEKFGGYYDMYDSLCSG
jgi:hypothetical protein